MQWRVEVLNEIVAAELADFPAEVRADLALERMKEIER